MQSAQSLIEVEAPEVGFLSRYPTYEDYERHVYERLIERAIQEFEEEVPPPQIMAAEYLCWLYPEGGPINVFTKAVQGHTAGSNFSGPRDACSYVDTLIHDGDMAAIWCSVHQSRASPDMAKVKWSTRDIEAYQFLAIDIDNKTTAYSDDGRVVVLATEQARCEHESHLRQLPLDERAKLAATKVCASDEELDRLLALAEKIRRDLTGLDLPMPALICTGNGYLLLFPIRLPNTEDNHALMARLAAVLNSVYSTDYAEIDRAVVQDPARILGVVGTLNRNKRQLPALGRPARRRELVGKLPPREPMEAGVFMAWAKDYCQQHDQLAAAFEPPEPPKVEVRPEPHPPKVEPQAEQQPLIDLALAKQKLRKVATAYLNRCKPAIEGQCGDRQTFNIAGHLLAFVYSGERLTVDEVVDIMLRSDWNRSCSPPWPYDELRFKVASAARNGTPRAPKEITAEDDLDLWIEGLTAASNPTDDSDLDRDADFYKPQAIQIPLDLLPPPLQTLMDYFASQLQQPGSLQSLFCGVYCIGASVGKRVRFINQATPYYPNLSIAILGDSGSNKSGMYRLVTDLLDGVAPSLSYPSSMTMEAFLERYGDCISPDKNPDGGAKERRRARIAEIRQQHQQNLDGEAIVVDEFRAFLLSMVRNEDSVRQGQLFCRLTENLDIEASTVGKGVRILADPCIALLGFSQIDPWNSEVRTSTFQTGGLAARIIPINPKQFQLQGHQVGHVNREKALEVLRAVRTIGETSSASSQRINVSFGSGGDPLGEAKARLAAMPYIAHFAQEQPDEWALLANKILIQAAKLAALFAMAQEAHRQCGQPSGGSLAVDPWEPTKTLDAAPFIDLCFQLVGIAHISNAYHIAVMTEQAQRIERVASVIKRKGRDGTTTSYLVKRTGFHKRDIQDYVQMLMDDGVVEPVKSEGGRTVLYRWKAKRG